jgi:hypothetical protein
MEAIYDMQNMAKSILYDLEKDNIGWEDEKVQFFLPIGLYFANFELLRVVAENTLIEEDNKIVQDFLSKVESMIEINSNNLHQTVGEKIKRIMEDL